MRRLATRLFARSSPINGPSWRLRGRGDFLADAAKSAEKRKHPTTLAGNPELRRRDLVGKPH